MLKELTIEDSRQAKGERNKKHMQRILCLFEMNLCALKNKETQKELKNNGDKNFLSIGYVWDKTSTFSKN